MYCPKCGQQQVTDTTRYCSRCGLPIHGLAEWLERGGLPVVNKAARSWSLKRLGIGRGAKLLFFGVILFPIFLGLSFIVDSPVPLFGPFSVFLAGISLILYTMIFGDDSLRSETLPTPPAALRSEFGTNALGAGNNNWTPAVSGRPVSTSELAQPPSVTENTTKLLVDD